MLFFVRCERWVMAHLNISEAAFRFAGGIVLFVALPDVLSARRQQREREVSMSDEETREIDNVALFKLATPPLACPSTVMSVIVGTHRFRWGRHGQPTDRLCRPAGGDGHHWLDRDHDPGCRRLAR